MIQNTCMYKNIKFTTCYCKHKQVQYYKHIFVEVSQYYQIKKVSSHIYVCMGIFSPLFTLFPLDFVQSVVLVFFSPILFFFFIIIFFSYSQDFINSLTSQPDQGVTGVFKTISFVTTLVLHYDKQNKFYCILTIVNKCKMINT